MECADIAVAVLAAGRAQRFGSDKLMVPINGMPLGVHIAWTLAPMGFGSLFAVCAKDAPISQEYAALDFTIIENATPETGQAQSLHLAVSAAEKTAASALLVVLADMPFVKRGHVEDIVTNHGLTASSNGITVMPPALFPRNYWPMLLETKGDTGARSVLGDARLVVAPPSVLRDIDVLTDLPRPVVK